MTHPPIKAPFELPQTEAAALIALIESAPAHIWLDLGENLEALNADAKFRDLSEVTWSEDNATGCGIKYLRAPQEHVLCIDFKQATELLAMFGGEPGEVTLLTGDGHSGHGLYAHYTEYPEEGAEFLGEPDGYATPSAALAATQPSAAPGDGQGALVWSSEQQPVADGRRYNHITAETPFGRILISWKGWKDRPRFDMDEHPAGAGPCLSETLEEAKQEAQCKYSNALRAALATGSMQVASAAPTDGYCSYCQLKGHEEGDCSIATNVKAGGDCSVIFGVLKDGERDPYPLFLDSEGYKARDFVKEHGGRIVEYLAAPGAAIAAREQVKFEISLPYLQERLQDHTCTRTENAGGTPGYTIYRTKLGAHPEYQLYVTEAFALWTNLGKALAPILASPAAAPTSQPNAAAQEQQAPLSTMQIAGCASAVRPYSTALLTVPADELVAFVRNVEAAHGIAPAPTGMGSVGLPSGRGEEQS